MTEEEEKARAEYEEASRARLREAIRKFYEVA